MLKVQLD